MTSDGSGARLTSSLAAPRQYAIRKSTATYARRAWGVGDAPRSSAPDADRLASPLARPCWRACLQTGRVAEGGPKGWDKGWPEGWLKGWPRDG